MTQTAYYWDAVSLEHDTGAHAESVLRAERLRPERMRELIPGLDARPVVQHDAAAWICRVHDRDYHDWVKATCERGGGVLDHGDTPACARSYDAAVASVDAALTAADAIMAGEARNAFSAMRPPGHHALPSEAMGFCLFGNVAILARYLQQHHGIRRIAIVDWDVHHGNGTQHVFSSDSDVLFVSLHQYPHYPGTGSTQEQGEGPGKGTTMNVPIPPGTTEDRYLAEFDGKVLPALRDFKPEFLLVSAGFDAHAADPLSELHLTEGGYAVMTRRLKDLAAEACKPRIISCLEGGYDLEALERSVAAHVLALME